MTDSKDAHTPTVGKGWLFFFTMVFYLVLSLAKMRGYFFEGRFWAEEGTIFFTKFSSLPFLDRIFYIYYGHLELPTNLVVTIATLFPFKQAPLVTTHLSFLLQTIPVIVLIAFHKEIGIDKWGLLALILILVGLPQASEVWATSTNLHFHFSLLAALIAVIGIGSGYPKVMFRVLLAVSGLSGIPSNFLVPVFFGLAVTTKHRERWVQFGIIATTCAIQLVLLVANSAATGPRTISLDPRMYWLPVVSQQVLSPLLGHGAGDSLSALLQTIMNGEASALPFAVVSSVPIFYFIKAAFADKARGQWVFAASAVLLSVLSIVGSIGDKIGLISSVGGGRYFFASNVLVAIFILATLKSSGNRLLRFFVAVLLVTSAVRIPGHPGGPPWGQEYQSAVASKAVEINIWPTGWRMKTFLPN